MLAKVFRYTKRVVWPAVEWGLLGGICFIGIGGMGMVGTESNNQMKAIWIGTALLTALIAGLALVPLSRQFIRGEKPFTPWDIDFLP